MKQHARLSVIAGVFLCGVVGWATAGYAGTAGGLALGVAMLVIPWRRQPLWSWAAVYLRRNRAVETVEPVTIVNDRCGGGVRFHDDVAVTAVHLLGKPRRPTLLTGSTSMQTDNTLDIAELTPLLRQSLGLTIESLSVISSGSRRRALGDYPRVYDSLIGTTPYAGRRQTWMIIRIRPLANGEALQRRDSVGSAALAAAQRISAALRCRGIRAKVATATDMLELERRLAGGSLDPAHRHWHSVRGDSGWYTTYGYRPADLSGEVLAQAWSLPADGITQNVTIFSDGSATATVTVHTAQPPKAAPSVRLQTLPGEQGQAVAANLCGPLPEIRGLSRGPLPRSLMLPVGASGVLLGRTPSGDRLLLPLADPGEQTRIHLAAEAAIVKRIIIRTAAAGERVTVHSRDGHRWDSVRMPNIVVTEDPRPAPGTTVSVVDGTVAPAPRPSTVISVYPPDTPADSAAEVIIAQTHPHLIRVTSAGRSDEVEVEFFRAENRYVSDSVGLPADLVAVE